MLQNYIQNFVVVDIVMKQFPRSAVVDAAY